MSAKRYLNRVMNLEQYIRAQEEDKQKALAEATNITQKLSQDVVQTSGRNSQEERVARYVQISMDIDDRKNELLYLQDEVRTIINSLEDNRYKAVLTLRYIVGRSWGYICETLSYSRSHVNLLHGEALKEFERSEIYETLKHRTL